MSVHCRRATIGENHDIPRLLKSTFSRRLYDMGVLTYIT